MQHEQLELIQRRLRESHLRILVAATHDAPWFAERVSWQAFDTLQGWGIIERGACKLTEAGRAVVAELGKRERFWERFLDTQTAFHIEAATREPRQVTP